MAVIKEFSIEEFAKEFGKKGFVKRHREAALTAVYKAILKSIKPITERTPVDTGLMRSSWEVQKTDEKTVTLGNIAPHAIFVELGARPHTPNVQAIKEWAARQLKRPISDKLVERFSWAVIKKIQRDGLEPKNILSNSIEDIIKPKIKQEFQNMQKHLNEVKDDPSI